MNQQNITPVRIGRVSAKVQETLGLKLDDPYIYVQDECLFRIAQANPEGYLTMIENASSIIRNPDFVSNFHGYIEFARFVFNKTDDGSKYFSLLSVIVKNENGKLLYDSIGEDIKRIYTELTFVRVTK